MLPTVAGSRASGAIIKVDGIAVPMGDRGCLSLFGDSAVTHRLLRLQVLRRIRQTAWQFSIAFRTRA